MNDNTNNNQSPLDEIKRINESVSKTSAPVPRPVVRHPVPGADQAAGSKGSETVKPRVPSPVRPPVRRTPSAPVPVKRPSAAADQASAAPRAVPRKEAAPVTQPVREPADKPRVSSQPTQQIDTAELLKAVRAGGQQSGGVYKADAPRVQPPTRSQSAQNAQSARNSQNAPVQPPRKATAAPSAQNGGSNNETKTIKAVAAQPRTAASRQPAARTPEVKNRQGKGQAEKKSDDNGGFGKGVVNNSVKAVLYIVFVLLISGALSLFTIFVGNDVFAFVKDDTEVKVTIPEGADLGEIADILGDNGVIKYPSMFKLYINLRKKGADKYLSGDFTVSPSMPYDQLISTFKESSGLRQEITITFTEGMTVDEIIDRFVENGIGKRDKFVDVIQNYAFDYWFVDELDKQIAANPDSGRKYRLEGYLFPDTYNFYTDSTEQAAINRLLANFDAKFDDNYKMAASQLGMTCDQAITLASIIQKEAKYTVDYPLVSSVFHNRLNHTSVTDGKLESNATVQYTMPKEEVRLDLTIDEINRYDNAYNTYLYKGLPVGAISNPSLDAIYFALYPQDSDYYYFISNVQGYNLYARNWNEHQKNREKVDAERAAAAAETDN